MKEQPQPIQPETAPGEGGLGPAAEALLTAETIWATAARIRTVGQKDYASLATATVLGRACDLWRDRSFGGRRRAVARIAASWGFSEALLNESLDALLAPFSAAAFDNFAARVRPRHDLIGFIMPGNVPGAGLHEVATALTAGAGVIVKTASAEPVFFSSFARTIAAIDPQIGARIAVMTWGRERGELTDALRASSDRLAAFGDDGTIARLKVGDVAVSKQPDHNGTPVMGFGSRVSGALVTLAALAPVNRDAIATALARDATLFEQRGCLSLHHVFVEDPEGCTHSRDFAASLAQALEQMAARVTPPQRYALEDAVALRRARETARWRALGGQPLELWEGAGLGWAVIHDACGGGFQTSPGYRTVWVSPVANLDDLVGRLQPMSGRLEAFAVAAPSARSRDAIHGRLAALGVSQLCEPGAMQSPPLAWRHGGGVFADMLLEGP